MDKTSNKYLALCIYLALASVTLSVFWQVRHHEFINFDDGLYIVDNSYVKDGLTQQGLAWAFSTVHAHNWHPLTWLSHMLDSELYGLDPGRHHFTNVLFHIANAMLLFYVFNRMTKSLWPSAFVAAAFALHPLHVESVAWASERKDVLSALFWMLTMAAYLRYTEQSNTKRYLLVVLVFSLGLMAKQMLVTLPVVLLLLDYWPLRRFKFKSQSLHKPSRPAVSVSARQCILEKLPLLVLSAVASVIVYSVQQRTGVMKSFYPLFLRVGNALVAYIVYTTKMLWPGRLAIFYPHPGDDLPAWQIVAAAFLLICITVRVFRKSQKCPYLVVGWLWYLATLLPVIGLVQVGLQAWADRYTYVPLTGLFMIIAWGIPDLFARLHYRKTLLSLSAAVLLPALGIMSWYQVGYWRNNITLYRHATTVVRNNCWAYYNLGRALATEDKLDEAITHFTEAIRIKPNFAEAHTSLGAALLKQDKLDEATAHFTEALRIGPYPPAHLNLGIALLRKGKSDEAIAHFNEALRIRPDYLQPHIYLGNALLERGKIDKAINHLASALAVNPNSADTHNKLGIALFRKGKLDKAITHFNKALQIEPDSADAHSKLAVALFRQGNLDQAITHFNEALQIEPNSPSDHSNLGVILARQGKLNKAVTHFRKALKLQPHYPQASANLGMALVKQGNIDEAIIHYTEALKLTPDALGPMDSLAWLLATHKDTKFYSPQEAIRLAERTCELTGYKKPGLLNTLAAAYAAAGRFPDATATAEKALQLAQSAGQNRRAQQIQNRLLLYKAGKPYVESPPKLPTD